MAAHVGRLPGCAASTATLRDGIETMVRAAVPEIARIVDVTDPVPASPLLSHDSAGSPSPLGPRRARGRHRAGGRRHVVDSAYLAPRLRLDVRHCASRCTPVGFSAARNAAKASHADCVRLTLPPWRPVVKLAAVRSDGRVIEIPPPLTRAHRPGVVRPTPAASVRFSRALPPDTASVAYAQDGRRAPFRHRIA